MKGHLSLSELPTKQFLAASTGHPSINNQDKITRAIGELFAPDIYLWQRRALGFWWKRSSVSLHRLFFKYDFCLLRNIDESPPICQILSPRAQMLFVYSLILIPYFVMWYRIMFNKIWALIRYNSSLFFSIHAEGISKVCLYYHIIKKMKMGSFLIYWKHGIFIAKTEPLSS